MTDSPYRYPKGSAETGRLEGIAAEARMRAKQWKGQDAADVMRDIMEKAKYLRSIAHEHAARYSDKGTDQGIKHRGQVQGYDWTIAMLEAALQGQE